jgi:23S rRNA pseudouridine2605 synthase
MRSSDYRAKRAGLARALSKMGFCSRAEAALLIRAGRVALNGKVRRDPETPVRLGSDSVQVDGRRLEAAAKVYLMLNKPRGVVTTASDEQARATVYDYLTEQKAWVAPVGRLDKASEGLLLLSNDSEWAARILSPETHLEKTYHVQIGALASDALMEKLRRGVRDGGEFLRATRVSLLRSGERNCWLEIVLEEGKNRQIRRMLDSLGIEVLRVVRVAIGPLKLGDLPKGKIRSLTSAEKAAIDRSLEFEMRLQMRGGGSSL